jgi:hypothetical protein
MKNSVLIEYDSSGTAKLFKVGSILVNLGSFDFYNDLSYRRSNSRCQVISSNLLNSIVGNLFRSNTEYTPVVNIVNGEETYLGIR